MIGYDDPRREDGDEDRWDDTPALCDVCGNRPGEVAQDGEWVCVRCSAALELTGSAPASTPNSQKEAGA